MRPSTFSKKIVAWQMKHGRHHLPWQQHCTPYHVWLSEIMLQQTQVTTVIPYYNRFIKSFSTLTTLAQASIDEVLGLWSGLGYYARARNLHKTATLIMTQYNGQFPDTVETLSTLPGIGPSTAGAILSFAFGRFSVILDGNVKRILTRTQAIEGWPGQTKVQQTLWQIATDYTPKKSFASYNQGMMDLGSMICTRTQPKCISCPVSLGCKAYQTKTIQQYPTKKPKKIIPQRKLCLLILLKFSHDKQSCFVLLEKRPSYGIWGGLWGFPQYSPINSTKEGLRRYCAEQFDITTGTQHQLPIFFHQLTHLSLEISPVIVIVKPTRVQRNQLLIKEASTEQIWYDINASPPGGVPTPISTLLNQLKNREVNICGT